MKFRIFMKKEEGIYVSTIAGGEARMLTRQLAPKVRPEEKRICVMDSLRIS
jgi:hypothetical protein